MKALIINQTGYDEGQLKAGRFWSRTFRRLVVMVGKDRLAITVHGEEVLVTLHFQNEDSCIVLGEVEVPDELVEKALAFARAKEELNTLKDTFKTLLGS